MCETKRAPTQNGFDFQDLGIASNKFYEIRPMKDLIVSPDHKSPRNKQLESEFNEIGSSDVCVPKV